MPIAAVLELRALQGGALRSNPARAAHAAILDLIESHAPALLGTLHAESELRPLSVAWLPDGRGRLPQQVTAQQIVGLRVSALSDVLEQVIAAWDAAQIRQLSIAGLTWQVERISLSAAGHPWAKRQSYATLIQQGIAAGNAQKNRWTLEFVTPVSFRQNGVIMPLPLPDLVLKSLLARWRQFALLQLPPEIDELLPRILAISRFELRSAAQPGKGGVPQIGSVGRCTYTALEPLHDLCACAEILLQFAHYSGIGAGTVRGMGMVRLRSDE